MYDRYESKKELRHFIGQPVKIFTDEGRGRGFRGFVLNASEDSYLIIDRNENVNRILFNHNAAIQEPHFCNHCRHDHY